MSKLAETLYRLQKHPAMYFGRKRSIHDIAAFIVGFQHGQDHPPDSLSIGHFTQWVAAHYRVNDGAMGGFPLILEHVGGDEHLAFDEFFRLLPDYIRDLDEIGPEGIKARYDKVMGEIRRKPGV